jgi:phosphate transport system permease protein
MSSVSLRKILFIDRSIFWGLAVTATLSVAVTLAIIVTLGEEAFRFFSAVPILDFLLGLRWEPLLEPKSFGVLPLVAGTMLIVAGSSAVAIPAGLATAIYLNEYASGRTRSVIKPALEILAGIPTVVYGYFAISFVTPGLRMVFPETEIFNAASGMTVVGIMILPMVSSLCDDALKAIPRSLRDSGYALGATPFEVTRGIMIPYVGPRIVSAFILAISRAVGETMAVTLAAGATPKLTLNPLESIQTMTAYIVQVSLGDTPSNGIEYLTCFSVGALLFTLTFSLNLLSHRIIAKPSPGLLA